MFMKMFNDKKKDRSRWRRYGNGLMIILLLMIGCGIPVHGKMISGSNYNKGKYTVISNNHTEIGVPVDLKVRRKSSESLEIQWTSLKKADGYILYCYMPKIKRYKCISILPGKKNTCFLHKELKKNTTYHYYVRGFKKEKKGIILGKKTLKRCARTSTKTSKIRNASKIEVNTTDILMIKGNTISLKGKAFALDNNKVLSKRLTFYSSNPQIASVSAKKGIVKANNPGRCVIYIVAHNGYKKSVHVTVRAQHTNTSFEMIAHRGARDIAPENSLIAIEKAYPYGYRSIELDVWENKKGEFMICHDRNLSVLCGKNMSIYDLTTDNRKNYPIIYGVNVEKYRTQYIPTLSEALKVAAKNNLKVYLHYKYLDSSKIMSKTSALKMKKIIKNAKMENRIVVFSAGDAAIRAIRSGGITAGLITRETNEERRLKIIELARKRNVDTILFKYTESSLLTKKVVNTSHKYGIEIGCYSISTQKQKDKMIKTGADKVVTNCMIR